MADGELQLLARDVASLSPDARMILESELQRRGVAPEVDLHDPDLGQDVIEWDELVIIKQFRDLPEALLARGALDSSGIPSFLVDDNMVRMDWFISNLVGGIELCVHQQDAEAAVEALNQTIPANIEVDGAGTYEQPTCPHCDSLDITVEALNRPVAFGSAWIGVPVPLKRKRWKCNSCGQLWKEESSPGGVAPDESTS
jgi:hypothetical protein